MYKKTSSSPRSKNTSKRADVNDGPTSNICFVCLKNAVENEYMPQRKTKHDDGDERGPSNRRKQSAI